MTLPTDPTHGVTPPTGPSERTPADSLPAQRFGKYVRTMRLGAGGMGEVWKAWDTELNRWVALKFLKGDDGDEIARFKREAQLAGKLNHPGIGAIYDVGFAQERHYIAMQFVEGQTLRTCPRGDAKALAGLVRDAAIAVAFAHEKGVVHRDLKPENLMVTPAGHLYVMDFGLARSVEAKETMSGMVLGTPSYMPPEQARGERADARADVYALGATLYELLTDRAPIKGGNLYEILKRVQDGEIERPRRIDPRIDADLETIVLKCLEKERERRYASAGALAEDLTRWLGGEAIEARPASMTYRLRKGLARRKAVAAALLLALVAVGVGGGYGAAIALRTRTRETKVYPLVERARELVRSADAMLSRPQPSTDARKQRLAEAGRLCREALDIHADYAPAHLVLGLIEMHRGDVERAIGAFDAALARDADYVQGRLERAKAYAEKIFRLEHETGMSDDLDVGQERRWLECARRDLDRVLFDRLDREQQVEAELLGLMLSGEPQKARDRMQRARDAGEAGEGAWRVLGEMEHRQHATGAAADAYRHYLDLRRGDARGWGRLAHMLHDCLKNPEAAEAAQRAIELDPDVPEAYYERGFSFLERGEYEAAIRDFDRAIELKADYAQAFRDRGVAWELRGEIAKALRDAEAALRIRPDLPGALSSRGHAKQLLGDVEGAIRDYDRALAIQPHHSEALCNRGSALAQRGDMESAMRDFEHALQIKPDAPFMLSGRAYARLKQRDFEGAIRDYDRALLMKPDLVDALVNRGSAKLGRGDLDGARADWDQALKVNPHSAQACYNRGNLKRDLGEANGAMQDYDRAVELKPDFAEALHNRGCLKYGRGDLQGALRDYDSALAVKADFSMALNSRGGARLAGGDARGAILDLDRALELEPDCAEAVMNRGLAKLALRDLAGAIRDADRAVEIKPDLPEALYNRGVVRQARGEFDGAFRDYDRAVTLRPHYPEALTNRGCIRLRRGEFQDAIDDFEAALRSAPKEWPHRDYVQGALKDARARLGK